MNITSLLAGFLRFPYFVLIADCAVQEGTTICTSQGKRLVDASAVTDENVSKDVTSKYFNSEAWSVVRAVVNAVKHDPCSIVDRARRR